MSYLVRPNLFPLLVRKQLDLTLAHGHTPSSPLVLAGYGLLLVILGDHAGSQRFGEVGMLLAERPEFREARPQTVFMYLNFVRHWRHPLRDGLGELRDAVEEALDQGDQEYAGFWSRSCSPSHSGSVARSRRSTPSPARSSPTSVPSPCPALFAKVRISIASI